MAHMPPYPEVHRQQQERKKQVFRQKLAMLLFLFGSLIATYSLIKTAYQEPPSHQE